MPDITGLPAWVWVVVGVTVVVLLVGGYFLFRYLRYTAHRRFVVRMVPKMEAVEAARKGLETVMCHLLDDTDEALLDFASSRDSVDRVALTEVESRMRLLRDELDLMSAPADVIPLAEALADAAHVIAQEAGRVHEDMDADAALAALATIDLAHVADVVVSAGLVLKSACEEYRIEDPAVYGGGLYI